MKRIKILLAALLIVLAANSQTVSVGNVAMNANESASVDVKLTGGSTYIATGFSVVLPDGFSFTGDVTNGTDSHVTRVLQQNANTTKVAIYSSQNMPFVSNDLSLLSLQVNGGTKSGSYQGRITGIELASSSHALVTKPDVTFTITVSANSGDLEGDVNSDGTVGIGDIVAVTNVMAGITTDAATIKRADVNDDGTVGIGDIVAITNIMAGIGSDKPTAYLTCPDANHPHLIDLGLPSGTLWACCNVGASAPEDYGGYYAWGEVNRKDEYTWDTYEYGYYNDDNDFSHLVSIGTDIAGTKYDAATANWGASWKMPSLTQMQELKNNTTSKFETQNGIQGLLLTASNGGKLFIPAAGYHWNGFKEAGSMGAYWSSTLFETRTSNAYQFGFYSAWNYSGTDTTFRLVGNAVRPVQNNNATSVVDVTNNVNLDASSWGGNGMVTWAAPEVVTADGRTTALAERYVEPASITGTVLEQTLTGLPNGTYKVELYANAYFSDGRGFSSDVTEGQTDMVHLFANDTKLYIPVHIGTEFSVSDEYSLTAKVTDGTLHMGMYSEKVGTNWWTIQIKSISRTSN